MTKFVPHLGARESLRRLTTPHALHFGSRLLRLGSNDVITFREFVAVARELVAELPEQTSVYLAALVAMDMASEDPTCHVAERSPN